MYNIADYRLEDVITTIDSPVRTRFVQAVTGAFRRYPDWEQMRETIREWCESGFSLVGTARRLHIHRNTLIYRLEKIERLNGEDIHSFPACFNFYFALLLGQYSGPAAKESAAPSAEE